VYHYQLLSYDGADANGTDADFAFNKTDYQDYYCIPGVEFENEAFCTPWKWVIHGYNTNGGSHTDVYEIDYDAFDIIPVIDANTFVKPAVCANVTATSGRLNGNDLFLHNAAQVKTLQTTAANAKLIQAVNQNKEFTFRTSQNKFFGMDIDNFKSLYTGYIPQAHKLNQKYATTKGLAVPAELDLRVKGVATPVKDQAVCGSCWTFGTAGTIEGRINYRNRLNQKPLVRVSE